MGFLSPLLLWVGAAAAVPVVLHLLHRHHGPRIPFPALRYLRRAEREHARRIRLRQLVLLALRVAAILVVAGAAARPFLPGLGGDHVPTAVAIVLDNSFSSGVVTGEERFFDRLRRLALVTVDEAAAGDRLWVLRAAEPEAAAPGLAPDEARSRIAATGVTDRGADVEAALRRARLLVRDADLPAREIHLLSDLQATSFPSASGGSRTPGVGDGPDDVPTVVYAPEETPPPNRSVAAVEVAGGLPPRENERFRVAARVSGPTSAGDDSTSIRVSVEGSVRATGTVSADGTGLLTLPPLPAGRYPAAVEIDPDALRGDDVRRFVLRVLPPPGVAVVGGEGSFVEEATEVLREARRIVRREPAAADVVVAVGGRGADAVLGGAATVVVPPADPTALPAASRRLARAGIPWRLRPAADRGSARISGGATPAGGTRIDVSYALERTDPGASATVLASLETGDPWAVTGRSGDGRYLLLASPLVPEATPLPVSERMIPFVEWLLTGWAAADPGRDEGTVGEPLDLPDDARLQPLEGGTPTAAGGTHRPGIPPAAGIYRVLRGDSAAGFVAVNPPPGESRLRRISSDALPRIPDVGELGTVRDTAAWREEIFRSRRGGEIWRPLLVVAGVLLLAELAVAATGGGRGSATESERIDETGRT